MCEDEVLLFRVKLHYMYVETCAPNAMSFDTSPYVTSGAIAQGTAALADSICGISIPAWIMNTIYILMTATVVIQVGEGCEEGNPPPGGE